MFQNLFEPDKVLRKYIFNIATFHLLSYVHSIVYYNSWVRFVVKKTNGGKK
jgi:hypothetical protein